MFSDFEPDQRLAFSLNSDAFSAYRRLGLLLLDAPEMRERYGLQAVAISPKGLFVFVAEPTHDKIPLAEFSGHPVEVVVTGPIVPASRGGEQIWNASHSETGTFGFLVEDARHHVFGLTCDHVAGNLAGQHPGDAVDCRVLTHNKFHRGSSVVLSTSACNRVDAALIELGATPTPGIVGIGGMPTGVNRALNFGDTVYKSGAATKVTMGVFSYIVTMIVPYTAGQARFVDQIGIDGGGVIFADRGDSGAVVIDTNDRVAGLLFAAAPQSCMGFANPIDDVETDLGVLVT